MNKQKLRKIKLRIEKLRGSNANIRSRELISIAKALGRTQFKRGREPNYISSLLPGTTPISIPNDPNHLINLPLVIF